MPIPVTELDDVQGLIKTGYGPLTEAFYLLLRVRDAQAARYWLQGFYPTTMGDLKRAKASTAKHVAISAPGLAALGLGPEIIEGFSPEFVGGMAADPARSRRLGDVGDNAPEHWDWGGADWAPDLLLMLFAEPGGLEALKAQEMTQDLIAAFETRHLPAAPMDGREPFGFLDGLSQPTLDWEGRREPNSEHDLDYGNQIAIGEFVLGYPDEYGLYSQRPLLRPDRAAGLPRAHDAPSRADLGRNGSYLVLRQLQQDVKGFWTFIEGHGGMPLAEAMVGRKLDGEPLVATGSRPIRGISPDQVKLNGFDFESDGDGLACPVTGHVRRANPRTGDVPGGDQGLIRKLLAMLGFGVDRRADTIASSRFHRLLRRGRKYGPTGRAADPDAPVGLHFVTVGASIARQFEFVQGAWLSSAKFAGLSGEQDPLLGARQPFPPDRPTDGFRWPQADGPCKAFNGLPQFVTVRGGAYFFLPGVRALRFIAGG